ncbi:hypothetical protein MHU86_19580 [Fragilaria crotonensis]|nr:hypothetical protein MHU86_19580 [Fragilaria crotonensis]
MMNAARQTGPRFLVPLASAASLSVLGVVTLASCEEESTVPVVVPTPVPVRLPPPPSSRNACRSFVLELATTKVPLEGSTSNGIPSPASAKIEACLRRKEIQDYLFDAFEAKLIKENQALPLSWSELDVDWSKVWKYAKSANLTLDDFGATPIDWKPFLSGVFGQRDLDDYVAGRNVVFKVRINLYDTDGAPVFISYAKDQSGTVLGYSYFKDQKEGDVKEDFLRLYVEPGKTMSVKLYKVYEGEKGDQRIYVSKAKYLVEAAFEAGLE